jgi:hypothetical protein
LKHPDRSEVRQVHFFSRPGTASARDLYPKDETQNRLGRRALHIRKAAWDGEPVFANITRMLALNRFPLRSKRKVNTQWLLFCLVNNIGKIHRYAPG